MAKYQTNYKETIYPTVWDEVSNKSVVSKNTITRIVSENKCSCFSSSFSALGRGEFEEIVIYIKGEYIGDKGNFNVTEEEVISWLIVLEDLGFKFEYLGEVKDHGIPNEFTFDKSILGVKISIKNNTTQSIKLFLNLIRYLYEDPFMNIIKKYYKCKEILPDADSYSLIHYCNYITKNISFSGHNCFYDSDGSVRELVDSELLKTIFMNKINNNNKTSNELNSTNKIQPEILILSFRKSTGKEDIIKNYNLLKRVKLELVQ